MNNKKNIKEMFEDKDFVKYNKWFFNAKWKDIEIDNFEYGEDFIHWKNGIWLDGFWKMGTWHNGIWYDGRWGNGDWLNGLWLNGTWENGRWQNGRWKDGIWVDGQWVSGKIWDSKNNKYKTSKMPPNECKWSLSYEQ